MPIPPITPGRIQGALAVLRRSTAGAMGRSFESVLGILHVERAYYYCPKCQSGVYPRDRALSLEDFSLSPGVLRMVSSAACLGE